MKGHWPRGRRRHDGTGDASRFVSALMAEFGAQRVADLCGVSPRTVRRWVTGEDWPTCGRLLPMIEKLFPAIGSLPIYSPDMALDGGSRVLGVGEYTLRAARGVYHGSN